MTKIAASADFGAAPAAHKKAPVALLLTTHFLRVFVRFFMRFFNCAPIAPTITLRCGACCAQGSTCSESNVAVAAVPSHLCNGCTISWQAGPPGLTCMSRGSRISKSV